MKKIISLFSLIVLILSCNTTEPPQPKPPEREITLAVEDTSCIEAWIKITTTNLQLPTTVTLKKNNTVVQDIILQNKDSVVYIDSLLPKTTYTFQAFIRSSNQTFKSSELNVTTMDTTSHNFTWQTWTFGENSSSALYDVAIIDENNIWAVGEIYMNDSLGNPDPTRYNLVVWDGNNWTIKRVPYYYQGQPFYNPIQTVFAFGTNDIWFGGNGVIHWDGNQYNPVPIPSSVWGPHQINKIWGTSSSDLYIVGNNGNIAHFNGTSWQKIESGTDLNIQDIWGVPDGNNGFYKYLAADNAMLKINQQNELTRISVDQDMILLSIWAKTDKLIYTAGNGVFLFKNNYWEKIDELEANTTYRIKGEELNEIYGIVLPGSTINYFNGYSWYQIYTEQNNRFWRIDSKGKIVAATGYAGDSAIITIIRKN